jgi:hypothetical protein
VTIVAGLLAVSAKETQILFAVLALLPTLAFWILDAYYQERLFRGLYDRTRTAAGDELAKDPYTLSTAGITDPGRLKTLFRPVILAVHGPVFTAVVMLILILW